MLNLTHFCKIDRREERTDTHFSIQTTFLKKIRDIKVLKFLKVLSSGKFNRWGASGGEWLKLSWRCLMCIFVMFCA